jgi:hypothetical protein
MSQAFQRERECKKLQDGRIMKIVASRTQHSHFVCLQQSNAGRREEFNKGLQEVADQIPEWTKIGKSKHARSERRQ